MRWRSLLIGVCACLSVPSFAQSLNIGVLPAADSIVLYTASDGGFFQDEGLEVNIIPFKSALEIGAAMRSGQLDGHFGDLMNVLTQNETGVKQTVVLTTTHTTPEQRSFALLVSPQKSAAIEALSDLNGTATAMSSATIIEYLLDRMKATRKLPDGALSNQEIRQIPIRMQMLLSGKVDTALLPEPLVTVVENAGGRVIWDDRDLDETLAVVALKKEAATKETVAAFRRAVAVAAAKCEEKPERTRELMIKRRLLPEKAAQSYTMVRFSLFGRENGLPPLPSEEEIKRVGEWMAEHGMLKAVPAWSDVVFPE